MSGNNDLNQENNNNFSKSPSQQISKMEMMHFKDDVLKDIKILKREIIDKYEMDSTLVSEKILNLENKINSINKKIAELSLLLNKDNANNIMNQMTTFAEFKNKTKESMLTMEIKINNVDKELKNNIYRIDNILSDSVIYPAIIGRACKYKTFHQLLDYILSQISQNKTYREKNTLDLNSYKKKLESLVQSFQVQKDSILNITNKSIDKKAEEIEEKFQSLMKLYDERLQETRAQNADYMKNMENTLNIVRGRMGEFQEYKDNIFEKINEEKKVVKDENEKTQHIFIGYKREFNLLKEKFTQLSEFIKDVRFRVNIGEEVKRREFFHISNKIDFSKPQKYSKNSNININSDSIINEFPEFHKRRSSVNIKEIKDKPFLVHSPESKSKGRNHKLNYTTKRVGNYSEFAEKGKKANFGSIYNNNKIEKVEKEGITSPTSAHLEDKKLINFLGENALHNRLDNKNKNLDLINLSKISSKKDENNTIEAKTTKSNKDKGRKSVHIGNYFMKELKILNESKSSSEKSSSSELNYHINNNDINNINKEKEKEKNNNKNNLSEKKKNNEKIDETKKKEERKNGTKNINNITNNLNKNNDNSVSTKKSNNFSNINNNKLDENSKSENKIQITKNKENQPYSLKSPIKSKKSAKKNAIIKSVHSFEENFNIDIKNNSIHFQENQKGENTSKQNIFETKDNKNDTPKSKNKKNNKNNFISHKSPKKINNRTKSALNRKEPNISKSLNNKKEPILRSSISANNIKKEKNQSKKIVIDSIDKTPLNESNTLIQKSTFEEDLKNQNIYNANNILKNSSNNNAYNDIYSVSNYSKFKSQKSVNNLSPNAQALLHGAQRLYNNKNFFGRNNNLFHLNKKNMNMDSNKSTSLFKTVNNYNNYQNFIDRNNEAREIQGIINNLKNNIKGNGVENIKGNK